MTHIQPIQPNIIGMPHDRETWNAHYGETTEDIEVDDMSAPPRPGHRREQYREDWPKRTIPAGTTVRIVMVSRFGDVGITDDLAKTHGYATRIDPEKLANRRMEP